jgi:hypothetical protein
MFCRGRRAGISLHSRRLLAPRSNGDPARGGISGSSNRTSTPSPSTEPEVAESRDGERAVEPPSGVAGQLVEPRLAGCPDRHDRMRREGTQSLLVIGVDPNRRYLSRPPRVIVRED